MQKVIVFIGVYACLQNIFSLESFLQWRLLKLLDVNHSKMVSFELAILAMQ